MLLTAKEQAEAAGDVARMILASNVVVPVLRKSPASSLYGSDDASFLEVVQIPIEIDEEPPIELSGKIDAIGTALPDANIIAEDRIVFQTRTYRVQAIHDEFLFGILTHKTLHLVTLHDR